MTEKLTEAAVALAEANKTIAEQAAELEKLRRFQAVYLAESAAESVFDEPQFSTIPAKMRRIFVKSALVGNDLSPEAVTTAVTEAANAYVETAAPSGGVVGNQATAITEAANLAEAAAKALAKKHGITLEAALEIVEGK